MASKTAFTQKGVKVRIGVKTQGNSEEDPTSHNVWSRWVFGNPFMRVDQTVWCPKCKQMVAVGHHCTGW